MILKEFPEFDFGVTTHARLRPDERCLDDGLISTAWNAGTLHVQYVGLDRVDHSNIDLIGETMWKFVAECQMMIVLYAGILLNQSVMQQALRDENKQDETLTFVYERSGNEPMWVRVPKKKVIDAFSVDGVFEKLYAKAFVIFTYQLWEEFARPKIATALNVVHDDVKSDLMGEWRHLRNLLVHPSEENGRTFVDNSEILISLGVLNDETREIDARTGFLMMAHLNTLRVMVNPKGLDPAMELGQIDPETIKQIADSETEPGMTVKPIWRNPPPVS